MTKYLIAVLAMVSTSVMANELGDRTFISDLEKQETAECRHYWDRSLDVGCVAIMWPTLEVDGKEYRVAVHGALAGLFDNKKKEDKIANQLCQMYGFERGYSPTALTVSSGPLELAMITKSGDVKIKTYKAFYTLHHLTTYDVQWNVHTARTFGTIYCYEKESQGVE